MTQTVHFRGTPEQAARVVRRAARKALGSRAVLSAAGRAVLKLVYEAFGVKSQGGTDAAGLRWPELAAYTKRRKGKDDILVEDGDLEASLEPVTGRRKYQVFRGRGRKFEVGTRRPFALAQHRGIPGRLPQRRLWPEVKHWPKEWWKEIAEAAKVEVVKVILQELRKGP